MPPPERPCGRTPEAGKWSSWASVEMKQSSSSPVASSTAPMTSSPSLRPMTSHSSRLSTSGLTRLTTPSRVPSARPGPSVRSEVSASARSPASRATSSLSGTPPATWGSLAVEGSSAPMSMTGSRTSRPRLVSRPTSPRLEVRTAETVTSWLARSPPRPGASASRVRARRPVEDSRTKQGSSLTSTAEAAVTAGAAPSRTVRRGVPCSLATSVSSSETTFRSSFSSARIASSCSIVRSSSLFSFSSSSLLNLVRRRSGMSRM